MIEKEELELQKWEKFYAQKKSLQVAQKQKDDQQLEKMRQKS